VKPADPATPLTPPALDWPAYWLVCLERAIAEGDYAAAAHAQRELRRLGIDVTMKPLRSGEATPCQR
jgi:hypothetical protein